MIHAIAVEQLVPLFNGPGATLGPKCGQLRGAPGSASSKEILQLLLQQVMARAAPVGQLSISNSYQQQKAIYFAV